MSVTILQYINDYTNQLKYILYIVKIEILRKKIQLKNQNFVH